MIFKLTRPVPALPESFFWTWDHSTNWVLDDPGLQTFGSYNSYLKTPDTFVEDYRRLSDLAAGLGIKGIIIWGFLRDSHGGVEAARKVASHAMGKGVHIMPGIGTTWYGGIYYEGDHPTNIDTFLKNNPSAKSLSMVRDYQGVCPSSPLFKEWMEEGLDWLFDTFDIGGANFENGDFFLCGCDDCKAHKANWPKEDPEFFRLQALGYKAPLEHLGKASRRRKDLLVTWATYTGFLAGMEKGSMTMTPYMGCDRPVLLDHIRNLHATQWTLTRMLRQNPLPLTEYLDDGMPESVFDNDCWPKGLCSPVENSVGFLHQGSQWRGHSRYDQVVGTIKEACLRAHLSGLKGVSIHGEVTSRHIPAALNYLAFSHFTHWPLDSLLDFGRKTLGEIFEDEYEGEAFSRIFAHWDAGSLTQDHRAETVSQRKDLIRHVQLGSKTANATNLVRFRFWCWLHKMVMGEKERHTANFF
ncbi:MAG: hypothetical protein R6W96_08120 [Clostridia bacterium]